MNRQAIINELKQGFTITELARKYHVKIPTAKVIRKKLQYPDFKDFFINAYLSITNTA